MIKAERAIASEALVAENSGLTWLVSYGLTHGLAHVRETFGSCWGTSGELPRPRFLTLTFWQKVCTTLHGWAHVRETFGSCWEIPGE